MTDLRPQTTDLRPQTTDWTSLKSGVWSLKSERGLTFIELLMAVTVFATLLVGLSSHVRGSVVAWRRVTSTTERLQRVRVALERLPADVTNAFVFDPSQTWQPGHQFASDRFSCYTIQPSSAAQGSDTNRVVFVTYTMEPSESPMVLTRTVRSVREASDGVPGESHPLLDEVEGFALRYGVWDATMNRLVWIDRWDDQGQVPGVVRVALTMKASAGAAVEQTMLIPTGSLSPPAVAP